jgi:hypothetical protein
MKKKQPKKLDRSTRPSKRITSKYEFESLIKLPAGSYELVKASTLKPHPDNPNKHTASQLERLMKLFTNVGFRSPIVVSRQSGYIVHGHGRLQALQKLNWSHVPVQYQSFSSEAEEYASLVSDNAVSEWSTLDLSLVNGKFHEFGPNFDIELLGLKDFDLNASDDEGPKGRDVSFTVTDKLIICPHCGEQFEKSAAETVEK